MLCTNLPTTNALNAKKRILVAKRTAFALSRSNKISNQRNWCVRSALKLRSRAVSKVAKLTDQTTSTSNASSVAILPNGFAGVTLTFVRAATRGNAKETTSVNYL